MRKALLLFFAVLILAMLSFTRNSGNSIAASRGQAGPSASAAQTESDMTPDASTSDDKAATISSSGNGVALPQSASSLPLYGFLAVGFLCASYMTLRTD
jgi:hypothetical protein